MSNETRAIRSGIVAPIVSAQQAIPNTIITNALNDANYTHKQTTAATVWNIPHNLNKYPSVNLIDIDGNVVLVDVKHIDLNNIVLTLATPMVGVATLN